MGNWESDPDTHIGNEKGSINKAIISHRPSDQFIYMINEVYRTGTPQGEGWDIYFYDEKVDRIKCKSVFGMGFIVNYVEAKRTDDSFTLIAESVDSMPEGFEETQWKLKLTKSSEDQFLLTLYMGKEDEFSIFWEARYNRI
ncbi:MAG: hypothetical protein ACXAC2_23165 [Candidatus Kariarchaeaceae archaeon]